MIRSLSRSWWLLFGLLGLVCLFSIGETQAWERPPLKVNTVFQFKVEVKVGPEIKPPTAPWYSYFPADQRLMPSMQATPYPPWPVQFPPQGPPPMPLKDTPKLSGNVPAGPMQTQYWPTYYAYGSNLQPVGFVPAQAPSYWYQNR